MMTPRNPLGRPFETSPLLPPRDPTSPAHLWKQVAAGNEKGNALTNALGVLNQDASHIPLNSPTSYGMHPWKIYPYVEGAVHPDVETSLGITDANRWRCIRVRTGVITDTEGILDVFQLTGATYPGCDAPARGTGYINSGSDAVPVQSNSVFLAEGGSEYNTTVHLLPSDEIYFVVVTGFSTTSGGVFGVGVTTDPKTVGWGNWPSYNPYFHLIGWVDMRPRTWRGHQGLELPRPLIYQLVFGALDITPRVRHYGTWTLTPPYSYPLNAIVTAPRGGKTASYISLVWANTFEITDTSKWALLGEYDP